ncbi:hypothetical protein CDL15_Pgr020874 [Punica granatum]|uniref:Ribosomal protein L15 n=1 Tax=Punica granatum TaxID=22663 RepID=A0A218XVQ2_PUNGR|nr:hypothetical protein CDL15_Pgr020874 [Punica granatum]
MDWISDGSLVFPTLMVHWATVASEAWWEKEVRFPKLTKKSYEYYEVILVDAAHKAILGDPGINWMCKPIHKHKEIHGWAHLCW